MGFITFADQLGAIQTFSKPVDNEILLATIKELLA
jgi:hypothetical protein